MPREDAVSDNSTVATPYGNIVSTVLEDGKKKMEFFDVDGTLEVTAIETAEGSTSFASLHALETETNRPSCYLLRRRRQGSQPC
jgi:hypothetical protein